MNDKKLILLVSVFTLHCLFLSAQTNKVYMIATPSAYPDTVNKPSIIIDNAEEINNARKSNVKYETETARPEPKLFIGKASIAPSSEKVNSNPADKKEADNNEEQNNEAQHTPIINPSVQPKK
ncbi:MAG: hypothetical protein JJE25_02025 [Bacteroidia bacterium]|nr:hypothetical protein [Bacteroidia bacterium]